MEQGSVFKKLFNTAIAAALSSVLLFPACKPSLDEPAYNSGDADFSRYVAIGGSYTAGYMDNALSLQSQLQSFPALLASRFQLAGGGTFKQPLVNPGNGMGWDFNANRATGRLRIVQKNNCLGALSYLVEPLPPDSSSLAWIGNTGPFQNMGVPGAKSSNLNSQQFGLPVPAGNPFFRRMASDRGQQSGFSSTILGDAVLSAPSFFTIWLGTTDVYNYALNGGEDLSQNAYDDITGQAAFLTQMNTALTSLTAGGAKGVIANVPDITDIPYFNTIPFNGLILKKAEADSLNVLYATLGLQFSEGANPYVVRNPGSSTVRQLKPGELVILNTSTELLRCNGLGRPTNPLAAFNVLDLSEVDSIRAVIQGYNATINSLAGTYDLALADMNTLFKTFKKGILFNGVEMNAEYLEGGVFSTDGMNPNGRGYALIANEFIRVINNKYRSNLPPVDVTSKPGVVFP